MNLVEPLPEPRLTGIRRAHFMAIDGAGMSPIAHLWRARGIAVDGCDRADSPVATELRRDGIAVAVGHDPAHLRGVDTVVVSSAIRESNSELATARETGLRVWHRSAALAALMSGHVGLAVSGTHGKSTTTAMIAAALRDADCSYVLGATPAGGAPAYHDGARGGVFVIEADESDGSFLQYEPALVVLTNIESDHLDRWGTPAAYADGFARFAAGSTVRQLVVSADDPGTRRLARPDGAVVTTFGTSGDADVRLGDIELSGWTAKASVAWPGGGARLELAVPGLHNLRDAAAAVAAAVALARLNVPVDMRDVIDALRGYRGLARRFQLIGRAGGIAVVDDYAHHPTEVAATIAAARAAAGPGRRVAVCFQPHLFSRTRDLHDEFGRALAQADMVVVCDVYGAREDPIPGVTGELVASAVSRHGGTGSFVPDPGQAVSALGGWVSGGRLRPGDLIVLMGAGDITSAGAPLLALLRGPEDA